MFKITQRRFLIDASGALVFEVGLFDASAEGHQVGVALDPFCQLVAGQLGGQYCEEMAKHQCIQLCGPMTHKAIYL